MKDYYQILGVEQDADENDIRTRYRRLAMEYHPDRNPDDPQAEEKFKEIAEAYGVLTDPVKRREYDAWKKMGGPRNQEANGGFQYSQEEILKDLFGDPSFSSSSRDCSGNFRNPASGRARTLSRKVFLVAEVGCFSVVFSFLARLPART